MRRSTLGHSFSFGFGLAVALTSLWVGNGDDLWAAACAGLFTALGSEITCSLWREVNPPPRKTTCGFWFSTSAA
jgi:hypothetical protein